MDRLTSKTFATLVATVLGSLLIILGGIKIEEYHEWWYVFINFNVQWHALGSNLTAWDGIGIALAIALTMLYAINMIMVL
jgi:hypothetical protein